jgi:hypothetical protein
MPTRHPEHFFVGSDAPFTNGPFGFVHHALKQEISLDLVETLFHVGIHLDGFPDDQAPVSTAIRGQFFEKFVASLVQNELFPHGCVSPE